ncbi:MAG: helix-turn-helix transcriptional regulator [Chitinophagaceae bacterium]|nr:helix-turn-helix transcriptional regulator [Chitinophagaceae bacterium]
MATKYDIESLQKARELIDEDTARHYTIEEIARHVAFSSSKLKKGFKKLFGMGLYKYLQCKRLEKGKYLLENSEKPLKDISRSLGYKYENNFSTSFKKKFGISPGAWKNTHT